MRRPSFESASGLRPASAYLMIGMVLAVVCGKSWILACEEDHSQPRGTEKSEVLPAPDFNVVDREGRSLAQSVQRMSLRLSPRSMWQAHTPDDMAAKIAELLGEEYTARELAADFFPNARAGVIRVAHSDWVLDYNAAQRVEAWAHELRLDDMLWLVRSKDRAEWRLHWRPLDLLSVATRARHSVGEKVMAPITWSRELADGLAFARQPEMREREDVPTRREIEARRSAVWAALLPCADTIAVDALPPESVLALIELLDAEAVQKHQMSIEFEHERVYPARDRSANSEAWSVLGNWRYIGEDEARMFANDLERDPRRREQRVRELLDVKHPRSGLEGVAADLLARPEFDFIAPASASYRYRKTVPVHEASRRYYFGDEAEGDTPQVFTTLDADLQVFLHRKLRESVDEHSAAAAMGIVVDVQSGDVLAVDGCSSYEVAEFLPTWHLFSPGSTFKVVVMTTALEANVVRPEESFNTFNGHYPVPNSRRVIREAQGAPVDWIPAWMGISRSVNAVLVQIGMRIPAEFFHRKLLALGYHELPDVGIGKERRGHLTDLPWKPAYTHASVSFGHELSVTLWQHAGALATILRGGIPRPLRLVSGVEWGDEYYRLYLEEDERVFSEYSCATVREMMAEGARTGTGRHLAQRERELGTKLDFISKTGTTEKEPGVPCLHLEMKRNQMNSHLPGGRRDPDFITFDQMKTWQVPHRGSCYTSSICLAGRVPGEEREVMVLLVVDEPRSKLKFGSDVAGPTAASVLKEALGLTEGGQCVSQRSDFIPSYGYEREAAGVDIPWLMPHPHSFNAAGSFDQAGSSNDQHGDGERSR